MNVLRRTPRRATVRLAGIVLVAGAVAGGVASLSASPDAHAEAGIGGDPAMVNLRVNVERGARLSTSAPIQAWALSERDGFVVTPFAATVTFARSTKDVKRHPLFTKLLVGVAAQKRTFHLKLTKSERSTLRRAARRAHRKGVVVSIDALGQGMGRTAPSPAGGYDVLRVR